MKYRAPFTPAVCVRGWDNGSPSLKQFGLFLEFLQRGAIRLGQHIMPAITQPRIELFRLQDERHPMMIVLCVDGIATAKQETRTVYLIQPVCVMKKNMRNQHFWRWRMSIRRCEQKAMALQRKKAAALALSQKKTKAAQKELK
jgi:hypothetical protein